MAERHTIFILDFGSQYTQLIARRIRELEVKSEICRHDISPDELVARGAAGLVLSGGPASCYAPGAPGIDPRLLELGLPVLGICYGFQLLARLLGAEVTPGGQGEYGRARVLVRDPRCPLFDGHAEGDALDVWMSHGDRIGSLPEGFRTAASSDGAPVAAAWSEERAVFGVQFHPEVAHTEGGARMLSRFVLGVCGAPASWTMASFARRQVEAIRARAGENARLLCAVSGGVDSTVAAVLVHRAVGERLTCLFVDNGLLREGEAAEVRRTFTARLGIPLVAIDAGPSFLERLRGVADPEEKRRRIGAEFIAVFEAEAVRVAAAAGGGPPVELLVQGTLYPDVIESVSAKGPSAVIKSHHNVGGLPERMSLGLVEPLRDLFKDEVRRLGAELGIDRRLLLRHPFPGPGLAVRILGPVDGERLALLRRADAIVEEEVRAAGLYDSLAAGLYDSLWQAFGVLLPIRTVGVMGDSRTYESVLAVRAVTSSDGMTADWARLPHDLLERIGRRVVNEVRGINRVVLDITSKPPSTIEWE
jgi:GMP synthase (glutamine-hydrolysing)